MTELTDRDASRDDSDWLVADEPLPTDTVTAGPADGGRRTAMAAVGLVAAGALVGAVAVAALRPHSSTTANPTGFVPGQPQNGQAPNGQFPNNGQMPNGQLQGGQGFQGQGGFGGPGGVAGEQRLSGTVVSVGSSSVRIRTSSGTAPYGVTAQTELVRNGAVASLSAIRPGDNVFVHLIPSSGSSYVVERLVATATRSRSGDASSGATGTTSSGNAI